MNVLRYIDDDRAGPAGAGKLERCANRCLEACWIGNQKYVLCDCSHDCRDGSFLKCVGADRVHRHLAADDNDGHRVGHAIANRCNRIGRTWTRGDHKDADFTAGAGIAGRHETSSLLVGRYDQRDWRFAVGSAVFVVIAKYGVKGRQNRAATVAEYGMDVFVGEDLNDNIGATHPGSGERMPVFAVCGRLFAHFLVNVA